MASIDNVLTGQHIVTTSDDALEIVYSINNEFKQSATQYVLQGIPLTLHEDGNAHYALAVVVVGVVGDTIDDRPDFFFDGLYLRAVRVGDERYFPVTEMPTASKSFATSVFKSGIGLSANSTNNLICTKITTIVNFDEETDCLIGGMPIRVGRSGDNWYLMVREL